jgi:hypothetical protein
VEDALIYCWFIQADRNSHVLLHYYIKGAAYGPDGAYIFALGTPAAALVALILMDYSEPSFRYNQYVASANAYTQATAVTLAVIYNRHITHSVFLPACPSYNNPSIDVCDICL